MTAQTISSGGTSLSWFCLVVT